jgi:hypothetical protein
VLDLNGTVTLDGAPIAGMPERLAALSPHLVIHLATADTHGRAEEIGKQLDVQIFRIEPGCSRQPAWGSPSWGGKGWR